MRRHRRRRQHRDFPYLLFISTLVLFSWIPFFVMFHKTKDNPYRKIETTRIQLIKKKGMMRSSSRLNRTNNYKNNDKKIMQHFKKYHNNNNNINQDDQNYYNETINNNFGSNKILMTETETIKRLNKITTTATTTTTTKVTIPNDNDSCALCFFGLPRSFKSMVLPSIIKNLLIPNKDNHCDIFVHYYHQQTEEGGRSGHGGTINPEEIHLLRQEVANVYNNNNTTTITAKIPLVSFVMDTEEDFWNQRGTLLEKYKTTIGPDGNPLYYPWMAKSYSFPKSIENIVKQWHSIQSVWEHMDQSAKKFNKQYSRIAMLRNDVVYVTPLDIYTLDNNGTFDYENQYAVVPNWARFPINDRMIYGPYEAVKIWATERFTRLETHVHTYELGYGMHSERFLHHSIFPAITNEANISVYANPDVCFFRARADGSAWITDCTTRDGSARGFRKINKVKLVEDIVERRCIQSKYSHKITQIHCDDHHLNNSTR